MRSTEVVIIGGGLAGLAAGIHLSKKGVAATVIEKNPYPLHKVCGEYLSNEVLPYLEWLGADLSAVTSESITRFSFSSPSGLTVKVPLPLGGAGVSRYALDLHLYHLALQSGCTVVRDTVTSVTFADGGFNIGTSSGGFRAKVVIGAYGKRSALDKELGRSFATGRSPWLAVKAHYSGSFPASEVALHSFRGGYCGASRVEGGSINICYLTTYKEFKKYKDVDAFQEHVLCANPRLRELFSTSSPIFERPLVISQLCFDKKLPVENHILMAGDTAGLIHPLCGNGMAMALQAAGLASEQVTRYLSGHISRELMEQEYARQWKRHFGKRLMAGRMLARVISTPGVTGALYRLASVFPWSLQKVIRQTHGKPFTPVSL